MTPSDMLAYYPRRAREYERICAKPERQRDLERLRQRVPALLAGADVLEVACGTGYWTEVVAPAVRSVVATDANDEVLAIARTKPYPPRRVRLERANAYDLPPVAGTFTGGLAAFWWSHVPRDDLPRFLAGFHARLLPGSRVVMLDNRYVEGSSTPISRTDARGNGYQQRRLADGSTHEVLKNFPTPVELRTTVAGMTRDVTVEELPHYWLLSYETEADDGEREPSAGADSGG